MELFSQVCTEMAEPARVMESKNMDFSWYAIYTNYCAEQRLSEAIKSYSKQHDLNYETYLPLRKVTKKWRDRKIVKKLPLFKNYLFVKHDDNAFHKIKLMPGFSDYVRLGRKPVSIPPEQMDLVRKLESYQLGEYCKQSNLIKGRKVKICKGALAGYEGVLNEDQDRRFVSIAIKSLQLCMNVKLLAEDVVGV